MGTGQLTGLENMRAERTMFTYKRQMRFRATAGESFLAEGPTNEILDVYVSLLLPLCLLALTT